MENRRFAGRATYASHVPRPIVLVVLALAAFVGAFAAAEARSRVRALDHHAAVVNDGLVGSAFMIAPGLALTNAHVVTGVRLGGAVTILSAAHGAQASARLIGVSPTMDLALLSAPGDFAPVVRTSDAVLLEGLRVRAAGVDASDGFGPLVELNGTVVVSRRDLPAFGPGLVVSIPGVRPGFSGGPVLDAEGRLVGMLTAIRLSASRPEGGPDEAFVLRARAIRAEASRLLAAAGS